MVPRPRLDYAAHQMRARSRKVGRSSVGLLTGRSGALALALALVACAGSEPDVDAGAEDAAVVVDAQPVDASGAADAAPRDAGPAPDATAEDAGPGADAGGADAGASAPDVCATRSAEIAAAAGPTITVAPAGAGLVRVDGGPPRSLRAVVSAAAEGSTILLEDGTYRLPEAGEGAYTGLYFTTPNVTLRGASGDPAAVIIDSAYRDHGGSSAPITVAAEGVVLASFTVRRSIFHLIHLWAEGDRALIHDVHLVDGGQQFLKASPGGEERVDDVEVSCSRFSMTGEGRDNVWGYGPTDGNTTCYTGGIDTHDARRWWVHDSRFEGIYCAPGGPERPAHGQAPEQRGGQTFTGGLAEHAIHMWDAEPGGGHRIERNTIVDCARGVGLGFRAETYDTVIQNNLVFSRFPGSREHDVGISVERAHDTRVEHNTVFFASPDGYSSAIEYRWASTEGLEIRNNLTNRRIRARDGANATLAGNVTDAEAAWFVDAAAGDLHLAACDLPAVAGAGAAAPGVQDDVDQEPRGGVFDVGADHCPR